MDRTAKQLVQLLDGGDLETRMAAMRMVTELGISSTAVVRSLGLALREEPMPLKILALKGLARLGAREVVHMVTPMLAGTGELREYAVEVVENVGEPAIESLRELYSHADFHTRRAICTVLSRISTPSAIEFLFSSLETESFELQKHLSQCLSEAIDRLPPRNQTPVFKLLRSFLNSARSRKDLQSQVVGVILLGHFSGERLVREARRVIVSFGGKTQPQEVRRYALIALSASLGDGEVPLHNDRLSFLEVCLCEEDWENVAQHALSVYQRVESDRLPYSRLIQLLKKSPHFAVQSHLLERLQNEDKADVAKEIFPFLRDSRYRVRDIAEAALRSMPAALGYLLEDLSDSVDEGLCHRIVSIIGDYPQQAKRKHLKRALQRFMTLYDRNDRRYEHFLSFVRGVDPEPLRSQIYDKVDQLKKSKSRDKWLKISRYLQVLWDHHLITPDGRYTFALALIKLSNRDLAPHARQANLGLQVIRSLIYDDTPGLVRRVTSNRDLSAEDLFYVGFHFMEEGDELRPFARAMLEFVSKKYPRSRVAEVARDKLAGSDHLDSAQAAVRKDGTARKKTAAVRTARAARTLKKGSGSAAAESKGATKVKKSPKKAAKSPANKSAKKTSKAASASKKSTAKKANKSAKSSVSRSAKKKTTGHGKVNKQAKAKKKRK